MDYKTGNEVLDKELDERFAILSPTVRQLISGETIPTLAHDFAKRFGLDAEVEAGIASEIVLVLMYIEPVEDFAPMLMSEYYIPPEVALEIEKEITQKLFTPIRSELGSARELPPEEEVTEADTASVTETVVTPITSLPSSPAPSTPSTLQASRVMPKNETELPGSLLQNLKASLAHDTAGAAYTEEDTPKPSYGAILDNTSGK